MADTGYRPRVNREFESDKPIPIRSTATSLIHNLAKSTAIHPIARDPILAQKPRVLPFLHKGRQACI